MVRRGEGSPQAHPGWVRCLRVEAEEAFAHLCVSVEGCFITGGRESGRNGVGKGGGGSSRGTFTLLILEKQLYL